MENPQMTEGDATQQRTLVPLNNKKLINAWSMYDWANSVYSLVITSAIFPIYFEEVTAGPDRLGIINLFGIDIRNSTAYSYTISLSFLIVALILPILSSISDYTGRRKPFLAAFAFSGGFACMGLYFFSGPEVYLALGFSLIASVGYAGSLVFYDAWLPEIVTEDMIDRTSARGYTFGYIGSVLLMVVNLVMIQMPETFGLSDAGEASRYSFLMVGIWWVVFSLIPLKVLPDNPFGRKAEGSVFYNGFRALRKVWYSLTAHVNLRRYLVAFFLYNMAAQTVMYLATFFGKKELKLESSDLIMTILIIQLVAIMGAWGFARLSGKIGNIKTLLVMIGIWSVITVYAYFLNSRGEFFVIAFFVGLVMGGIQALSRATYAKLLPKQESDHGAFFAFYDVTFYLSIVFGTLIWGAIDQITDSMRNSVLFLAVLFVAGGLVLRSVKMNSEEVDQ